MAGLGIADYALTEVAVGASDTIMLPSARTMGPRKMCCRCGLRISWGSEMD